jgi:pimeloyl-ACP methyl ester carboxylesterase
MMAPLVNFVFWKYVMQAATGRNPGLSSALKDFQTRFRGLQGPWRLMSLLRWGRPAEVLSSVPAILQGLRAPTLILHGSQDPAVPEAFARRAAELLVDAEVVVLDSGHFFPLCEPELVAAQLLRFFEERDTADTSSMRASVSAF